MAVESTQISGKGAAAPKEGKKMRNLSFSAAVALALLASTEARAIENYAGSVVGECEVHEGITYNVKATVTAPNWSVDVLTYVFTPSPAQLTSFDLDKKNRYFSVTPGTYTVAVGNPELQGTYSITAPDCAPRRCGSTALIQSTWGKDGNFEVVVPYPTGGLAHYWRDNDDPAQTWHGPTMFGASAGFVDEVSLIESNFFVKGNFEVVARVGDRLFHFWRDLDNNWHESGPFASGVSGAPALIQSRFGKVGNFEVVAPLAIGGMAHFWRDNDDPLLRWYGPTSFGQGQATSACCELDPGQPLARAASGCVGECSGSFSDTFAISNSGEKCVCQRGICRLIIAMDGDLCPNQTAHMEIENAGNLIWSQDFTFGDSASLMPPSLVPISIPAASGDSLIVNVSFDFNGSSVSCKKLGKFNFSIFF